MQLYSQLSRFTPYITEHRIKETGQLSRNNNMLANWPQLRFLSISTAAPIHQRRWHPLSSGSSSNHKLHDTTIIHHDRPSVRELLLQIPQSLQDLARLYLLILNGLHLLPIRPNPKEPDSLVFSSLLIVHSPLTERVLVLHVCFIHTILKLLQRFRYTRTPFTLLGRYTGSFRDFSGNWVSREFRRVNVEGDLESCGRAFHVVSCRGLEGETGVGSGWGGEQGWESAEEGEREEDKEGHKLEEYRFGRVLRCCWVGLTMSCTGGVYPCSTEPSWTKRG